MQKARQGICRQRLPGSTNFRGPTLYGPKENTYSQAWPRVLLKNRVRSVPFPLPLLPRSPSCCPPPPRLRLSSKARFKKRLILGQNFRLQLHFLWLFQSKRQKNQLQLLRQPRPRRSLKVRFRRRLTSGQNFRRLLHFLWPRQPKRQKL